MNASFKILSPAIAMSFQDLGRFGYGGDGVPQSGAVDLISLRLANALLDNKPFEAGLEFSFIGPEIQVENGSIRIANAANANGYVIDYITKQTRDIKPWQTAVLNPGDILKISALNAGVTGYLAVEGGFQLNKILGSYSSYAKAKIGAFDGQYIKSGDIIATNKHDPLVVQDKIITNPKFDSCKELRVILGPQDDYFSLDTIEEFCNQEFIVDKNSNRMGIRLNGKEVVVIAEKGSDLISDGLVPGAIQIPGDGQPIILSKDCQTLGGYPKIATIITADMANIGQLKAGDMVTFKIVKQKQAKQALVNMEMRITQQIQSINPYSGDIGINLNSLYTENLIDGVVDIYQI